jgi:hypothetical protein
MAAALRGLLHGNVITLESSIPTLEGKEVQVLIEAVEEMKVAAEEEAALLREWAERGPQGPISDEDAELA